MRSRRGAYVALVVSDDGKGFDPASPAGTDHFGLTTMRGRHVRLEGAQLRFRFRGKSGKPLLGPMGWGGAVATVLGLGGLGAGLGLLGMAASNASLVSGA